MIGAQWIGGGRAMTNFAPPPRVLVAEDDDEVRALVTTVLRRDEYTVIEAVRGDDLTIMLSAPKATPLADLIVSDVRLPGASGLEAIQTLRSHDRLTPVLLITAYLDDVTRERAKALRIHRVFEKPFDMDELRKEILRLAPLEAFQHLKWPPPTGD